jgi:hypothetical protein
LDGYPRNPNDAKHIFFKKLDDSQDDIDGPFPGHKPDEEIFPQYVIAF